MPKPPDPLIPPDTREGREGEYFEPEERQRIVRIDDNGSWLVDSPSGRRRMSWPRLDEQIDQAEKYSTLLTRLRELETEWRRKEEANDQYEYYVYGVCADQLAALRQGQEGS